MFVHLRGSGLAGSSRIISKPKTNSTPLLLRAVPFDSILMKLHVRTFTFIVLTVTASSVFADHGPGTSGGGTSTQSAETLKPGKFSLETRLEFTEFDHPSQREMERNASKAGHSDLLDRSFFSAAALSYGVVENFQLSLTIGYYDAEDAREAEAAGHHDAAAEAERAGHEEDGAEHHAEAAAPEVETTRFNPDGLTDLLLVGKYRFYRGPLGRLAVIAGVRIPTGRHEVRNAAGEAVDPSATAGSGSWDFVGGLAYSSFITGQLTLDASAQYTLRTEHDGFKVGDRFDAGVAVAYRLTNDIERFPQMSVFAEANFRPPAPQRGSRRER